MGPLDLEHLLDRTPALRVSAAEDLLPLPPLEHLDANCGNRKADGEWDWDTSCGTGPVEFRQDESCGKAKEVGSPYGYYDDDCGDLIPDGGGAKYQDKEEASLGRREAHAPKKLLN